MPTFSLLSYIFRLTSSVHQQVCRSCPDRPYTGVTSHQLPPIPFSPIFPPAPYTIPTAALTCGRGDPGESERALVEVSVREHVGETEGVMVVLRVQVQEVRDVHIRDTELVPLAAPVRRVACAVVVNLGKGGVDV